MERTRRTAANKGGAASPLPASIGVGDSLLQGRYVLQQLVGRGSIATVYRGHDGVLDRPVAVKLLHASLVSQPRFVQRFLEMERRVARLFHPNLVTIFDAQAADGQCFVVMDYVSGGSLRARLDRERPPPLVSAIRIVCQVADALQALHEEDIVHGDVTPDNILLDDTGGARLSDFGIAHLATTSGVFKTEELTRTAGYLAPEQIQQGQYDVRSDVYALAAVAYELLTGRLPFDGPSWVEAAAERVRSDPPPASSLRPELSPELDEVLGHALAREPDERYQTAAAFRDALARLARRPAPEPAAPPDPHEAPTAPQVEPLAEPVDSWRRWPVAAIDWLGRARRPLALVFRWLGSLARRLPAQRLRPRVPARAFSLALIPALVLLPLLPLLLRAANPPREVVVPGLAGQALASARAEARQRDLLLEVIEEPSESAPTGLIVRQEPPAGATILNDQAVRLVVSSGPPPVRVPDLQHRSLEDARRDLERAGLALGNVRERELDQQPWGAVIEQSARPGSQLARGAALDLTVAVPPWTSTPRLADRSLGDAEVELQRRGLLLGEVRLEPGLGRRAGTVVAQEPAAEVRLRQGERVHLVIAVPPQPAPTARP